MDGICGKMVSIHVHKYLQITQANQIILEKIKANKSIPLLLKTVELGSESTMHHFG